MGSLIILAGVIWAIYAGANDRHVVSVFVSAAIIQIGYWFSRFSLMRNVLNGDGILGLLKLNIYVFIGYSILSGILFFISNLFS